MDRFVREFKKSLRKEVCGLKQVSSAEDCDVTMYFCPITSRAGTDIDAAVNQCLREPVFKQLLLVVIHPTIDPYKTILDSNNAINREDIYAVDFLFNEDEGFMKCEKNANAINKTGNYLRSKHLTSYYCLQQEHMFHWDAEDDPLFRRDDVGRRPCSRKVLIFVAVAVVVFVVVLTITLTVVL